MDVREVGLRDAVGEQPVATSRLGAPRPHPPEVRRPARLAADRGQGRLDGRRVDLGVVARDDDGVGVGGCNRHGVSGKELERTLGVTYKTAWRIGQQIRVLMAKADGFEMLEGHVEMDEAYVGGHLPGSGAAALARTRRSFSAWKQRGGRMASRSRFRT